jgi:hypothetical protein
MAREYLDCTHKIACDDILVSLVELDLLSLNQSVPQNSMVPEKAM